MTFNQRLMTKQVGFLHCLRNRG